jgi:hypothetical protein
MRVSSKNKPPRKREQKPGSLVLQGEGKVGKAPKKKGRKK